MAVIRRPRTTPTTDESKANPFPDLPDPLVLKNGKKVKDAKTWWNQRRPEIVEDFDREIYGRVPKVTPKVNWELTGTTEEKNGDVPIIVKKLVGARRQFRVPAHHRRYPVDAHDARRRHRSRARHHGVRRRIWPWPRGGSWTRRRTTRRPRRTASANRTHLAAAGFSPRAGAYAMLVPNSIQADNGAGLTQGVIGLVNKGQPRKLEDWGAPTRLGAGARVRALDYFETDKSVDAKRISMTATRATARRPWSRWPTISASPSRSPAPPARAA